jgi:hypothetical protein
MRIKSHSESHIVEDSERLGHEQRRASLDARREKLADRAVQLAPDEIAAVAEASARAWPAPASSTR